MIQITLDDGTTRFWKSDKVELNDNDNWVIVTDEDGNKLYYAVRTIREIVVER